MDAQSLIRDIAKYKNHKRAEISKRFFKTGKGEYGEGDIFLGLSVPAQRAIAKKYVTISLPELSVVLKSKIHEHRLTALLVLVYKYAQSDQSAQKKIFDFYLKHRNYVNNWDLVDATTPYIAGHYMFEYMTKREREKILLSLMHSKSLWDNRISVLSQFYAIRKGEYREPFSVISFFITHPHDLMHKACGWMLREIGKAKGQQVLEIFLKKYKKDMPRTMLRYAIERFPESKRKAYLKK